METDEAAGSCEDIFATSQDMFDPSQDMWNSSQEEDIHPEPKSQVKTPDSPKAQDLGSNSESTSVVKEEPCWRGTLLHKLVGGRLKNQFPPVAVGPNHSVLFKLPVREGRVPEPWPNKPIDLWDQHHVRMPHSASSLYPVTETELQRRWELVHQALNSKISSCDQLQAAILHYNSKYSDRWDFGALHNFFSETLEDVETEYFFTKVLPKVINLALSLPDLVRGGVPLLKQHSTRSVSLSQQQISCLLANAFLCTFPRRNTSKRDSEYSSFPDINFNRLFNRDTTAEAKGRGPSLQEKLKCLINYFRRVTTKVPEGVVTYSRHHVTAAELPVWSEQTCRLPELHVSSEGTIEDTSHMLQVDFANKFIGGGVLGRGCVQEEIRFVLCPELILARLFTQVLADTEAVIVTGCERFNLYRGYANTFEWAGNVEDTTERDEYGRRRCSVVCIDASRFPSAKTQYTVGHINRELNKAYAGFSWGRGHETRAVATGNWGCGAFRGDPCLKSLLQLMAAAVTGRAVAYFTFGDAELRDKLADMHSFLTHKRVTVGELWKIITSYSPLTFRHSLYDHIRTSVNDGSIPVPQTNPYKFKKPRVETPVKNPTSQRKDEASSNGHRLTSEEIEMALDSPEDSAKTEGARPTEAKRLSLQKDRDLCLKRLSSSWTNLNESKKDFSPSEKPSSSEQSRSKQNATSSKTISNTKKKKISDYFQSV